MVSIHRLPTGQTAPGEDDRSTEKHYSVQDLCELWKLSPRTIRRLFGNEPDVIEIGQRERTSGRRKRAYTTLRIPESVAHRVHRRLRKAG